MKPFKNITNQFKQGFALIVGLFFLMSGIQAQPSVENNVNAPNTDEFILPTYIKVGKVEGEVNTEGEEVKPVFSQDGKTMYFVRTKHPENAHFSTDPNNEDIWEATLDQNGKWSSLLHEKTINDKNNNSILGQGKADHYFLLNTYQDKRHLQYGIALTSKLGLHKWSNPEPIEIPKLKYDGDFYDFHITSDESILLISIKGADTKGQEDLYVCLNQDGKWTAPINLGSTINTTGFEMSPFLSKDKKSLYFSTDGRADGMGDADVYVSQRLDDTWTNWSTPKNLGNQINSAKMDCYFTLDEQGNAYFSSNKGQDNLDLYRAYKEEPKKPLSKDLVVFGNVLELKSKAPLAAKVTFEPTELAETDLEAEKVVVKTNEDGSYRVNLKRGGAYQVRINEKGYHEYSEPLILTSVEGDEYEYNVLLEKLEAGTKIKMDPLFFIVSTDTLIETSLPIVEKLATILLDNPDIKIRIEGHTDNSGTANSNETLSLARATRIRNILTEKGIKKKRMKVEGFGERKPLVKNLTEEDKQKNRRVEFIIID